MKKLSLDERRLRGTSKLATERRYAERQRGAPALVPVGPPPAGVDRAYADTWRELAEAVDELGVYAQPHRPAFKAMVDAYVVVRALQPGAKRGNVAPWGSALGHLARHMAQFGLTPRSTGKVERLGPAPPEPNEDRGLRPLPPLRPVKAQ